MDQPGLQPLTPIPPIPANPPVVPEAPPAVTPPKSSKPKVKKILVGALMLLLLAGGGWFGYEQMQQTQLAEKSANENQDSDGGCGAGTFQCCVQGKTKKNCSCCPCEKLAIAPTNVTVTPLSETSVRVDWTPADNTKIENQAYFLTQQYVQWTNYAAYYDKCVLSSSGNPCSRSGYQELDENANTYTITDMEPGDTYYIEVMGYAQLGSQVCVPKDNWRTYVYYSSASPSPSPSPGFSCVDLTADNTSPELDDTVTFTCEGSFSSVTAPVAYFRYSVDGGSYVASDAVSIDTTTNTADYDVAIDQEGDWSVQCRVCTDSAGTSCTEWGQAN